MVQVHARYIGDDKFILTFPDGSSAIMQVLPTDTPFLLDRIEQKEGMLDVNILQPFTNAPCLPTSLLSIFKDERHWNK